MHACTQLKIAHRCPDKRHETEAPLITVQRDEEGLSEPLLYSRSLLNRTLTDTETDTRTRCTTSHRRIAILCSLRNSYEIKTRLAINRFSSFMEEKGLVIDIILFIVWCTRQTCVMSSCTAQFVTLNRRRLAGGLHKFLSIMLQRRIILVIVNCYLFSLQVAYRSSLTKKLGTVTRKPDPHF